MQGRNDELLRLAGTTIHPLTIRSTLLGEAAVADCQVRVVTSQQLDIDVVAGRRTVDTTLVERKVAAAPVAAGASDVVVTARTAESLRRNVLTGKARRFVDDTVT